MLKRKAVTENIKERMQTLKATEMCALFLISVNEGEGENSQEEWDETGSADWAAGVLARFFRKADIVGNLGHGRYTVFLKGNITGNTIYEKAAGLVQALEFAAGDHMAEKPEIRLGVYLASSEEKDYTNLYQKAEYALEMARRDKNRRFYMYTAPDIQEKQEGGLSVSDPALSQVMLHYIDEGVRILEGGDTPKTVYVSPGYYRRLSLDEETSGYEQIRIHPDDMENYTVQLQEVSRSGKPEYSYYRVSSDGQTWIPCRIRLLRILPGSEEQNPVLIEISHNIAGLERLMGQLDEKTAWLTFVADQTEYQLWEVDIRSKVFRMLYTHDLLDGRRNAYEDFPESLIESGRIHSNSAEAFRLFAKELLDGRRQDSGNFMVQYRQTSCYGWAAMSYRMVYDENGRPAKAIGIKEELSYIPSQQTRFVQRRIMPSDLYENLYCYLQADLTTDSVEKLLLEGRERSGLIQYQTYEQMVERGTSRMFSEADVKRLRKKFNRERLLQELAENRYWSYDQCRIVDFDGSIRRISIGFNLGRDLETGDVCLYAYLSKADRRAEWEKEHKDVQQTDPETGIHGYDSWKVLVRNLMKQNDGRSCTLVRISIEGVTEVLADDPSQRKVKDILIALHVLLNTNCLVGQEENHSILVFFPGDESREQIRSRLENTFSFVRISLSGMHEMKFLRFVAAAVCGCGKETLEDMLHCAAEICALHAGAAADTVEFAHGTGVYQGDAMVLRNQENLEESTLREHSHGLTEQEKDMALACLDWMLRARSARDSLNGIMGKLGEYYQADRVYILTLTEEKQIMTMLNEWVRPGKYSIQQSISGKRTSNFPVIMNYAQHPEKIFLTRQVKKDTTWQYMIFPMDSEKDMEQMLCIENPRSHMEHTALIDQLLPHLSRERNRFREAQANNSPMDRFFALPNMEACMNMLYSIDSDTHSSLGVMAVDVPEYDKLKDLRGFEYGRQILLHIFEVLGEVFDKSLLFHTKETEFLILCVDVVYHTFLDLCARAKQMMGRQNKGLIRMGCTWADGVFSARDLVKKARSIMECDKPSGLPDIRLHPDSVQVQVPEQDALAKVQAEGELTIYLQPKINMQDGQLMGAEALVRILDKEGNLLPHGRMIEAMEQEGSIQKLDYFVFDRLLAAMDQWQKKGYTLYPMSSNFSRNTLLNPAALASVLAIMSRYPFVSQELLELEITETAGDYENNTFEELIRRFGEYGLRFSLDDFGSGYSNMNMLAELKFHSVKLDRSLIKNITENMTTRLIVRDLVHICGSCGMTCVAEGVENQSQVDMLLEDGCICGQGFYYDRPMSLERFEEKYLQPMKEEICKC